MAAGSSNSQAVDASTDQQLIDQCLAGRTEAFGELVERHQDRLYGTLVTMLKSPDDARDVAQDAFVLAFRRLGSFRQESAFYSWLFRIAHNAAISHHRRRRPKKVSLEAGREATGDEPTDERADSDPSYALHSRERQALLNQALGELGDEYRTAIILREIDGMSYEEIAQVVGCPVGTVRSRIFRARQDLREKLIRATAGEQ